MSQPNQQPTPEHRLGAHDFLNLEDELLKQNQAPAPQNPAAPQAPQASAGGTDSWLLGGPDEDPPAPGGHSIQPPPAAASPPPTYEAPPQVPAASVVSMDPVDSFTAATAADPAPVETEQPSWLMELDDIQSGSAGHEPVIPGSQGYGDHMEPVALDATYAEEEPTSRSVSRAAGRGLLVMLLAAASVGGWQIHQRGGLEFLRGAITGTRPIQLELGANGDEMVRPEPRTANLGASGRQSVERDGSTRPANTAGVLMSAGEPSELSIVPVAEHDSMEHRPEIVEPEIDSRAVATLGELESIMDDDREMRDEPAREEVTQHEDVPFALTGERPPLNVYPGEWGHDPIALNSMAMQAEMHRLLEEHLASQDPVDSLLLESEDYLAELAPEPADELTVVVEGQDPVDPPVAETEDTDSLSQDEGLSPAVAALLAGENSDPVEDVEPEVLAQATDEQTTPDDVSTETLASDVESTDEGLSPEVARLLAGDEGDPVEDTQPNLLAEVTDEQVSTDEETSEDVASDEGLSPEVARLLAGGETVVALGEGQDELGPEAGETNPDEDSLPSEPVADATSSLQDAEVTEELDPVATVDQEQPGFEELNADDWLLDSRHDLAAEPDDLRLSAEDDWLEGLDVQPDPELGELLTAELAEDFELVQDDAPLEDDVPTVDSTDSSPVSDRPASNLLSGGRSIFDQYSEFLSTGQVPDPDQTAVALGPDPVPTIGPDPLPGGEGPVLVDTTPEGHTDPLIAVGLEPDGGDPGIELPMPTGGDPLAMVDPVSTGVNDPVPDFGDPLGAQTDPLLTEIEVQTGENGAPVEEREGRLERRRRTTRWSGASVPMAAVRGPRVLLTPNVGDVRLLFKNGENFQGRLHSVGQNTVWLETKLGRMTFDASRIQSIENLMGSGASGSDPNAIDLSTLDKVRVRTRGGYIVGYLLSKEGNQVSLITEEGGRVTVEGEVEAASDRRKVRGRKRTDK